MKIDNKFFVYTIKLCGFGVAVLCVAELLLWGELLSKKDFAAEKARLEVIDTLKARIYSHWLNVDQADPFFPPFLVYSNTGYNDLNRLKAIHAATRLAPNKIWRSYDFLRSDEIKNHTAYTIHSNSLGARGVEQRSQKAPKTVRIVALGAYHTFGHGVEDAQAYPAQVAQQLNGSARGGQKYEVLNFGRHASTAIVGLAKMKYEIFNYDPDFFLFEYGLVDPVVWSDNLMVTAMRFPDGALANRVKRVIRYVSPYINRSLLLSRLTTWLSRRLHEDNTKKFMETMKAMIMVAREKNIPMILIKAFPVRADWSELKKLEANDLQIVSAQDVFSESPPTPQDIDNFIALPDKWIDEVDPIIHKELLQHQFAPYKINYLQMSPLGHRVLARAIAEKIREMRRKIAKH